MQPSDVVNNHHVSHADLFRSGVGVIKFWEHEGLEPKLLGSRPSWTVSTHKPHTSGPCGKPTNQHRILELPGPTNHSTTAALAATLLAAMAGLW